MENNSYEPTGHDKGTLASTHSMFPPASNPNYPESTSSSAPPPYANPSQYPPNPGMPYPQQYPPQAPVRGYPPQPYGPPPVGQPYYPPNTNQAFQPQYPQQQQQQQQVIVVGNQPAPVYVVNQPRVSMAGAICLSCFTFWCCGALFGKIAFILAMVGQSSASAGDNVGAVRLRNASYGVSIAGIVIGIIVIAIIGGVVGSAARTTYTSTYYSNKCNYYTYTYYSGSTYYNCK